MNARNIIPLPPNATPLELAYAQSNERLLEQAIPIDVLWDAWRCPSALLPWLGWAVSVDHWDDGWSEITKRDAIARSPEYHRIKGTRLAVEMALNLYAIPYEITEWWEQQPEARRGTFKVQLDLTALSGNERAAATQVLFAKAYEGVRMAKPKSRAFTFGVGETSSLKMVVSAGLLDETMTTIEPYAYAGDAADGSIVVSAGLLIETLDTLEAAA